MADLNDVYTPKGQEPTPCSLEMMWEDYSRLLKMDGIPDDQIDLRKDAFYYALQHLADELTHFTKGCPKADAVVRDYLRQALDVVMARQPEHYVPISRIKNITAN